MKSSYNQDIIRGPDGQDYILAPNGRTIPIHYKRGTINTTDFERQQITDDLQKFADRVDLEKLVRELLRKGKLP